MSDRPALERPVRRWAWTLGIAAGATTLISLLTVPGPDDINGLIDVLGLVFSVAYLVILGLSVLVARRLVESVPARIATIVVGPIAAMFPVVLVVRLLV